MRRQKLSNVKTEAWANTVAERLAKVKAETIGETLTAVSGTSLVLKLAETIAEIKTKAVNETLGDVEAKELVDTLLLEVVAKKNSTH